MTALLALRSGPQALVKVERSQRGEDVRLDQTEAGADLVWGPSAAAPAGLRYLGARRTWCRRRQQSCLGVLASWELSRRYYKAVKPRGWRARAWQELTSRRNSSEHLLYSALP
jgi:hypothetical protein